MAEFEATRSITLILGATVAQGRFVKIDSAGKAIQAAAALDDAVGVALEGGVLDAAVPVALIDGAKVRMEAGAAVTLGSGVSSDATGRAIDVTATLTDKQHGYALEAAGAAGEFITVLLTKKAGNNAVT